MYLAPTVTLTAVRTPLAGGVSGIYQTVKMMRQLVKDARTDPEIRSTALSIVFLTPEKDDIAECLALYEYVRDNIRYTKDVYDVETLSTPLITLKTKQGDCDDQSSLLAALFETVGYQTRFVIAGYTNTNVFEHVYVQVFANNEWFSCDPTENHYFGWEPPNSVCVQFEG